MADIARHKAASANCSAEMSDRRGLILAVLVWIVAPIVWVIVVALAISAVL
jgi:hypothetical protein